MKYGRRKYTQRRAQRVMAVGSSGVREQGAVVAFGGGVVVGLRW